MRRIAIPLACLALIACGGDDPADTDDTGAPSTAPDPTGGTTDEPPGTPPGDDDDDTTTVDALTLVSCAHSVAPGAPPFYADYFRCVDVTVSGGDVTITTDGLPPHPSPYYDEADPNWVAFDDRGGTHFQNPGVIGTATTTITVPASPVARGLTIDATLVDTTMGTSAYEYDAGAVGVALNGVAMFAAMAAPGDDIYFEAFTFDLYEGHPAGNTYHYHWHTPGPLEVLAWQGFTVDTTPGSADLEVYGIMCDGTVVLGCTELDGTPATLAGLDAQNGHVHDLTDGTTVHFADRYHTHVCPTLGGFELFPEIAYYETTGCPAGGPP